jgi:hypothetical protein
VGKVRGVREAVWLGFRGGQEEVVKLCFRHSCRLIDGASNLVDNVNKILPK